MSDEAFNVWWKEVLPRYFVVFSNEKKKLLAAFKAGWDAAQKEKENG